MMEKPAMTTMIETPKTSEELKAQIVGLETEDAPEAAAPVPGVEAPPAAVTPPPAAATPPVAATPPTVTPPAAEDVEDLPPTDPTERAAWAFKMRKKTREAKEKADRLEKELQDERAKHAAPPAPPVETPPPAIDKPPTPPEEVAAQNQQVFGILANCVRVQRGELVEGIRADQAPDMVKMAKSIIADMSTEEIYKVLEGARAAGPEGEEIQRLAREALTEAMGRQAVTETAEQREAAKAQELQATVDVEMQKVYTRWPALKPSKTPGAEQKFAVQWFEENVGRPERPGIFFGLAQRDPANVEKLFERCMNDYELESLRATRGERDTLKAKLERARSPQAAGSAAGESAPMGSMAILQQLQERGVATL